MFVGDSPLRVSRQGAHLGVDFSGIACLDRPPHHFGVLPDMLTSIARPPGASPMRWIRTRGPRRRQGELLLRARRSERYPGFPDYSVLWRCFSAPRRSPVPVRLAPRRNSRSARGVERGPESSEVRRPEDHAILCCDIHEIEVDSSSGDLASQVRQHAGAVLDIDHDYFALAGDRDMGNRQRMLRGLGMRNEDVELGPLAWPDARGGCDVDASLIAAATRSSAPGVFSMSMTRSTAMCPVRGQRTWARSPTQPLQEHPARAAPSREDRQRRCHADASAM